MLYDYQKIFGSREAKIRFTGKNDAIASPTRTQKADLQIYKSGAETSIMQRQQPRIAQRQSEHASGALIPSTAAQRQLWPVPILNLRRVWQFSSCLFTNNPHDDNIFFAQWQGKEPLYSPVTD